MSRTAEWNALQELLPYKPDLRQPREQAYLCCFLGGLLACRIENLKAVTEAQLLQARVKWQTCLGIEPTIAPEKPVTPPAELTGREGKNFLRLADDALEKRRVDALSKWKQNNHQSGEWGRAKLSQILLTDVPHFGQAFKSATNAELDRIETWIENGSIDDAVDQEPAAQAEESATDGSAL